MLAIHIGRHAFPADRGSARVVRLMMFTPALPEDPKKERVVRLFALVRAAASWSRQSLCGLRGHTMLRHYEPNRLSLKCLECGRETAGWTIEVRPIFRSKGPARAQVHRQPAEVTSKAHRRGEGEPTSPPLAA
jgi:hypothetical protein